MAIDMDKLHAFMGRFVGDIGAAMHAGTVVIGDKLGLYKALAAGPMSPAELARKTEHRRALRPRVARAPRRPRGYVEYDAAAQKFRMTDRAGVRARHRGQPGLHPRRLPGGAGRALKDVPRHRPSASAPGRASAGTSTTRCCSRAPSASSARATSPTWSRAGSRRSRAWRRKLQAGARVADVGCGHGASTILMAQAYPASRFVGFDYHAAVDRLGARGGAEAGVADRVSFEVAAAKDFPGSDYDLVAFFDCLHDMGDPVGAARHVRAALKPDGTLDAGRAVRQRHARGQPQPGRAAVLLRPRRWSARRPRSRRRSASRSARRPARSGCARLPPKAASPTSAAPPRRPST